MYPRETGHCFAHHVPGSMIDYDFTDYCEDFDSENSCDEFYENEDCFIAALTYIQNKKADLRKGDLIIFDKNAGYRNEGVAIYNGEKIVNLYTKVDDYGSVPQEFRVVEGGVPLNYWKNISETDPAKYGIDHNEIVWFNHVPVRDRCINRMIYGRIDRKYAIFTTFEYEGKEYRLILNYPNTDATAYCDEKDYMFHSSTVMYQYMEIFRKLFESDELIVFETDSYGSYPNDDHTLFTMQC